MDLGIIDHTFKSSDPEEKRELSGTVHRQFMHCRRVCDSGMMGISYFVFVIAFGIPIKLVGVHNSVFIFNL